MISRLTLVLALVALGGGVATGQEARGVPGVEASRDTLEATLTYFEAAARSQAYSAELRSRAAERATSVRSRLVEGDFRDGDRVHLTVQGEESLSDTFVVVESRHLRLPNIGRLSLRGVLRSELEPFLTREIGRYINDPEIRAITLVRISIFGEVNSPGFYNFPPGMPLTEVMMRVGGLTRSADVENVRLQRGSDVLMEGEPLLQAVNSGMTLDELKILAGDQIFIPSKPPLPLRRIVAVAAGFSTIIFAIDRIFR